MIDKADIAEVAESPKKGGQKGDGIGGRTEDAV
jgi:hypothetical protein